MTRLRYKHYQILLTLLSLFVLASSYYFEYIKGLPPCPLCLMQRLCAILLFMICFMGAFIHNLRAGMILAGLQFLFAAAGLFFSGRQLWLQSLLPGEAPSCMPDLDVLIRFFPWQDVVRSFLWGSGDCAETSWQWLGLSMPAWAALYFLFLLIAAIPMFWTLRKQLKSIESA